MTQDDQGNVDDAHPARDHRADVSGLHAVGEVHGSQREFLGYSLVAFAAGGVEVGVIDGGARIARRQDVVHSVATGAVCRNHRAAFGGEAVIAVHVGGDAIAGHAEFLREAHAFVAARAGVLRTGSVLQPASWDPCVT